MAGDATSLTNNLEDLSLASLPAERSAVPVPIYQLKPRGDVFPGIALCVLTVTGRLSTAITKRLAVRAETETHQISTSGRRCSGFIKLPGQADQSVNGSSGLASSR